jgi:Flp pilus assembly pilin Flp
MRLHRSFLRDCSGVTSAEFALVVGFFIVLVFGTINTGLALSAVNQIHYASERSARCLAVHATGDCQDDVDAYAKGWYKGPGVTALTFTPTDEDCGKRVVGTANYEILTGFESTAVEISATACYPLI